MDSMNDAADNKLAIGDAVLYIGFIPQTKRQHSTAPAKQLKRGVVESIGKKKVTVRTLEAYTRHGSAQRVPLGTSRTVYPSTVVKVENPDWPELVEFKREGWLDDLLYI
jgi:tartrate dehydratase beta subunit/fumarate hydratase class I family protein